MAKWLVIQERSVKKYWESLATQDSTVAKAFNEAKEKLAQTPNRDDYPATAIAHLKGEFLCHWEYRRLPNNRRIFFKFFTREEIDADPSLIQSTLMWEDDSQVGVVVMFYAGPHP